MIKKIYKLNLTILLVVGGFFIPSAIIAQAYPDVQITEIMYSPDGTDSGYEWVEIKNESGTTTNISSWDFNVGGSGGGISTTTVSTGNLSLSPHSYAVIYDEPSNFTSYPGNTLQSNFSLTNSKTFISLSKNNNVFASTTYSAQLADGNGCSLQLINGEWVAADPTRGRENKSASSCNSDENKDSSNDSNDSSDKEESDHTYVDEPLDLPDDAPTYEDDETGYVTISAGDDVSVIAGVKHKFRGYIETNDKNMTEDADFYWNFGTGMKKEGSLVDYTYQYPGTYEAFFVAKGEEYELTDDITITVHPEKFSVISAKTGEKGYIKLKNSLSENANISGWKLVTGDSVFVFPDHTIIRGNSIITISNNVSGLDPVIGKMKLLYPNDEVADYYRMKSSLPINDDFDVLKNNNADTNSNSSKENNNVNISINKNNIESSDSNISVESVQARVDAIDSSDTENTGTISQEATFVPTIAKNATSKEGEDGRGWTWIIALVAFLAISSGVVIALHRSGNDGDNGKDENDSYTNPAQEEADEIDIME